MIGICVLCFAMGCLFGIVIMALAAAASRDDDWEGRG